MTSSRWLASSWGSSERPRRRFQKCYRPQSLTRTPTLGSSPWWSEGSSATRPLANTTEGATRSSDHCVTRSEESVTHVLAHRLDSQSFWMRTVSGGVDGRAGEMADVPNPYSSSSIVFCHLPSSVG